MIKRLTIGIFAMMLVLMLASCSLGVNTISVDTMFGGESENGGYNYDLNQWTVGLAVPWNNKLTFSVDLSRGDIDNGLSGDTTSYKLKGAYRIFSDSKVNLALTGGIYKRDLELPAFADYTVSSLTFGVDGQLVINPKAWFHFGLAFGLLPNEELDRYAWGHSEGDPTSLLLFNLKFNYLVDKQLGLSVGYTSESYDSELLVPHNYHKGLRAGVFYRF